MVAKISHGSSLFGALSYNQLKVEGEQATILYGNRIIEPTTDEYSVPLLTRSFEPYLTANRKTESPVIHISLNPAPKDNVSDEQFRQMAQLYMEKLGYGNQPYVVFLHKDIDRRHIHIVSVRVDENGKMLPDNFEHARSMKICRELEKQFKLTPADKKQSTEDLPLKPVRPEEGELKQQLANIIRPLSHSYHFQSLNEYRALLSIYQVTVDEVKGEQHGRSYNGLVYSALNEQREKVGKPFKASLFGKVVGYEAMQKQMENSVSIIKERKLKERTKAAVSLAINTSASREEFEKKLRKEGISVAFRQNEGGRIYGVTFIDHQTKTVLNGSRLGKAFSANTFNNWFENGVRPIIPAAPAPKQQEHREQPHSWQPPTESLPQGEPDDSVLGTVVGLFAPDSIPDDRSMVPAPKRKKRKRKPGQQL